MRSTENIYLLIFGIVFIVSMMLVLQPKISGYATSGTTTSNVTIAKYLSIAMSGDLSSGILFGTVNTLPSTSVNATANNNSGAGLSSFFLNVSTDSNTAVDFCVKANTDLYDSTGGNTLGLGNETYSNATTTSATIPLVGNEVSLTTVYVKSGLNITVGNVNYYRFYLDVPLATPAGTYNNSINFEGVQTTLAC